MSLRALPCRGWHKPDGADKINCRFSTILKVGPAITSARPFSSGLGMCSKKPAGEQACRQDGGPTKTVLRGAGGGSPGVYSDKRDNFPSSSDTRRSPFSARADPVQSCVCLECAHESISAFQRRGDASRPWRRAEGNHDWLGRV